MKNKIVLLGALLTALFSGVNANASNIMFGYVGTSYYADGQNLAAKLSAMAGVTVTERNLYDAVYTDYSSFDQIWVYDLSYGTDVSATQLSNYQNIATWYDNQATQNLIVDGRIISSSDSWIARSTAAGMPQETSWIQNYATALDARGGGLVLGTDHATAFTRGINEINSLIGIDDFTGYYYSPPYQAVVDSNSPLYVPSLGTCPTLASEQCINDNSSTSFVPTGLQPNGQFLTPVAYHGTLSTAYDNAAVASTIGSITFGTAEIPEPSMLLLMAMGLLGLMGMRRRV